MKLTEAKARQGGINGARALQCGAVYRIDEDYVTLSQIGDRLGVTKRVANGIFEKAKRLDGPVTWERLRTIRSASSR